eukprot:515014-Pelagomonas_calceolata.AAC.6
MAELLKGGTTINSAGASAISAASSSHPESPTLHAGGLLLLLFWTPPGRPASASVTSAFRPANIPFCTVERMQNSLLAQMKRQGLRGYNHQICGAVILVEWMEHYRSMLMAARVTNQSGGLKAAHDCGS